MRRPQCGSAGSSVDIAAAFGPDSCCLTTRRLLNYAVDCRLSAEWSSSVNGGGDWKYDMILSVFKVVASQSACCTLNALRVDPKGDSVRFVHSLSAHSLRVAVLRTMERIKYLNKGSNWKPRARGYGGKRRGGRWLEMRLTTFGRGHEKWSNCTTASSG